MVRAVVDSGAEDTVAPSHVLPGEVQPSPMSRAGLTYRSASGDPIRNLGQMSVRFRDGQQRKCGMHFQLAEVDRPLISVARLVDAGNRVVFGPTGGFIVHVATGRKVQLVRDGNVYTLDMHLTPEPEEEGRGGATWRRSRRSRRPRLPALKTFPKGRVLPGRSVEGSSPARRVPARRAGPLRKSFTTC